MKSSPEDELREVGKKAAQALAHGMAQLNSFIGPEGGTYSIRLVSAPEARENNWVFVVDVVFPDQEKRIEFSIVQTGWGGFIPSGTT